MAQQRILVVEDQEEWQQFVTQALTGLEVELVMASDYGEGMRALREGPYDLLILDNTLKEIRGASIELMQAAHRLLKVVPPAFVHSAYLMPSEVELAKALGADYFPKQESRVKFAEHVTGLLAEPA